MLESDRLFSITATYIFAVIGLGISKQFQQHSDIRKSQMHER
jgi:hypothetical protein